VDNDFFKSNSFDGLHDLRISFCKVRIIVVAEGAIL